MNGEWKIEYATILNLLMRKHTDVFDLIERAQR